MAEPNYVAENGMSREMIESIVNALRDNVDACITLASLCIVQAKLDGLSKEEFEVYILHLWDTIDVLEARIKR